VVAVRPVIPLDAQRYGHDPRVSSMTPTPGGGANLELCGERVAVPAAYVAGRGAEAGACSIAYSACSSQKRAAARAGGPARRLAVAACHR
jgi:hypothetical protein